MSTDDTEKKPKTRKSKTKKSTAGKSTTEKSTAQKAKKPSGNKAKTRKPTAKQKTTTTKTGGIAPRAGRGGGGGGRPTPPPTRPPTQPPTRPPTQPPTRPPTQPPTRPPTQPPTKPPTQPPTKPPTQPPTKPPTQPPTKPPTQPPTKPPTQPPTKPPTKPAPPTGRPVTPAPKPTNPGKPTTLPGRPKPIPYPSGASHPTAGDAKHGQPGIHDGAGYVRHGATPTFSRGDVTLRTQSMARFSDCRNHFGGYYRHDNWPGNWHWRPINPGWGWCDHYWFDFEVDLMFICGDDYCFSEYWFEVETGQFFWLNNGGVWIDCLPDGYLEPITIRVSETVPVLDDSGNVIEYETQTFLYVALWDDVNEVYGYYDWQDNYHVVTFPWLSSW